MIRLVDSVRMDMDDDDTADFSKMVKRPYGRPSHYRHNVLVVEWHVCGCGNVWSSGCWYWLAGVAPGVGTRRALMRFVTAVFSWRIIVGVGARVW